MSLKLCVSHSEASVTDRQPQLAKASAEGFGFSRVLLERGGKTVQALDQEKIALAVRAPDQRLNDNVARP